MRQRRFAPLLVLCGALVAVPAAAEVFTVTLTNGATLDTRYRPRQAAWDPGMIELLSEQGNWTAVSKSLVSGITALSEVKGFGRVIDTTTIDLGFAPNDRVENVPFVDDQMDLNPTYDIEQFVEPGSTGGGIPVFGTVGGGAVGIPSAPVPAPAPPPPVPAPAPLAPTPPG